MPQSWPSQWTFLFILFTLSFLFVMIIAFFISMKQSDKKETSSYFTPQLIWSW